MKTGALVQMRKEFKHLLRSIKNGSESHIREFGGCVGIVIGPVEWPTGGPGPELDVVWLPSLLRYGYSPEHLKLARKKLRGVTKFKVQLIHQIGWVNARKIILGFYTLNKAFGAGMDSIEYLEELAEVSSHIKPMEE